MEPRGGRIGFEEADVHKQLRRRNGFAVVVALVLALLAMATATPAGAAQPPTLDRMIERYLRLIRFTVKSGRIQATSDHFDHQNSSTANGPEGRQERVTINLTTGLPSLDYEGLGPHGRLAMVLEDGSAIRFDRQVAQGEGPPRQVIFIQGASGNLSLRWGVEGQLKLRRAPTLWHLLIAEPEICREELLPVLGLLRPDWDLEGTLVKIEEALVRAAAAGRIPDRGRWQSLVDDLGADDFARRRGADRQLRLVGQAVVPFLQGLDPAKLNAEQRYRIRQVVASLAGGQLEDTAQSVAAWLAIDPRAWIELAARDDVSLRRTAIEQLARLTQRDWQFDPEAEAPVREAQLELIRQQLLPAPGDQSEAPDVDDEP